LNRDALYNMSHMFGMSTVHRTHLAKHLIPMPKSLNALLL
jgi:hypothetical protein